LLSRRAHDERLLLFCLAPLLSFSLPPRASRDERNGCVQITAAAFTVH